MRIFLLALLISIFDPEAKEGAKEKTYFEIHEKGWHWYRDQEGPGAIYERSDDSGKKEQAPKTPLDELKAYQKRLEEAQAQAVMYPTSKNVEVYQRLQYEAMERAHRFSNVWMENVYRNADLNYSLVSPSFQKARYIHLEKEEQKKTEKIKALAKKYGLFFFFKLDCDYCVEFAPIVKAFSEKYNWEVLAISDRNVRREAGETLEMFERNVKDNGLSEMWGVRTLPSLFAVNPKTGDVIPIAHGMISIEEMEERIMTISGEEDQDVE
jgi:conjugal transfer pilus assembly protein TraF